MPKGKVYGIDLSPPMVRLAGKRNTRAVTEGKAVLGAGDAAALPFEQGTFDKVFAVNVLYFWAQPLTPLAEIGRTMKKGGLCALFFLQKEDLVKLQWARTEVFAKYEACDALDFMKTAGFRNCRIEKKHFGRAKGVCVLGEKQ